MRYLDTINHDLYQYKSGKFIYPRLIFYDEEQLNTEYKECSQNNCYMGNCCFPRQKQSTYQ